MDPCANRLFAQAWGSEPKSGRATLTAAKSFSSRKRASHWGDQDGSYQANAGDGDGEGEKKADDGEDSKGWPSKKRPFERSYSSRSWPASQSGWKNDWNQWSDRAVERAMNQLFNEVEGSYKQTPVFPSEEYHWRYIPERDEDKDGHIFAMHLPKGCPSPEEKSAKNWNHKQWPVIFFFHGKSKKGTSFFHYMSTSRKFRDQDKEGTTYAAQNFIIVSPHCDWTWQDPPSTWVDELMDLFCDLPWVDPKRLYLTGHSQGGMSTWEVLARKPTFFAAASPMGAYQRSDEDCTRIVGGVAGAFKHGTTAILAVHGTKDERCKIKSEEPFWLMLTDVAAGTWRFRVKRLPGSDHSGSFSQMYFDTADIYKWFLAWEHGACPYKASMLEAWLHIFPEAAKNGSRS